MANTNKWLNPKQYQMFALLQVNEMRIQHNPLGLSMHGAIWERRWLQRLCVCV